MDSDREFCKTMLPAVSRTFAASIELLPPVLREPVRCGYLLCRILDTVEDSTSLSYLDQQRLFSAFDDVVRSDTGDVDLFCRIFSEYEVENSHDASLCRSSGSVFKVFRSLPDHQRAALRLPILTMSRGMRQYCQRQHEDGSLQMRNIVDLEQYCYFVAGTVGELLTALFLQECPLERSELATVQKHNVRFGIGLQLVNIVKDISDDAIRGVSFVPLDILRAHGLRPIDVLDPGHRMAAMKVVCALTTVARGHLEAAREYTMVWPTDSGSSIRLFLVVPLALAYRSLELVESGGSDVLVRGRNPKVSRDVVARILKHAPAAAESNEKLEILLRGE